MRERDERHRQLEEQLTAMAATLEQHQTDLTTAAREKENLETSLAAIREEVRVIIWSKNGVQLLHPLSVYPSYVRLSTAGETTLRG